MRAQSQNPSHSGKRTAIEVVKIAVPLVVFMTLLAGAAVWVMSHWFLGPLSKSSHGIVSDAVGKYGSSIVTEEEPLPQLPIDSSVTRAQLLPETVAPSHGEAFMRDDARLEMMPEFPDRAAYVRAVGPKVTLCVRQGATIAPVERDLGARELSGPDYAKQDLGKKDGTVLIRIDSRNAWGRVWVSGGYVFVVMSSDRGEVDEFVEMYPY